MAIDQETINELDKAGIAFVGSVRIPGGIENVKISPNDIVAFITDRADWYAHQHGVLKSDYLEWIETDGLPRCGAQTSKGIRCKNPVSGGIQRKLFDWLQEDGGFCRVHGGPGSKEAMQNRFGRK